jgi:uncharacterized protein YecE (DUF72 family)
MQATIHIGTSGWHYRHWRGIFYPDRLKTREWLAYYAEHFDCVEVNSTFYRMPEREVIAGWRDSVPSEFVFAVKAPRRITHFKKLKNCGGELNDFFGRLEAFGNSLGPVLFQLPPRWRCNARRLEHFLDELPPNQRLVFEFRDPTWHNDEVYALLASRSVAFCIFDGGGTTTPMIAEGDLVYIRLHGPGTAHTGTYRAPGLRNWVDRARGWNRASKDVFLFFDNDERGYAIKNGARAIGLLQAA